MKAGKACGPKGALSWHLRHAARCLAAYYNDYVQNDWVSGSSRFASRPEHRAGVAAPKIL
ncbi:hypothetical protein E2C01_042316 [Portunus trituberculatus]|uniref:Uncharacterized protein n=1 Tax=Portunus trituberculatus TaxID=210409 RepID=A0A5B7FLH6_PORTR|nr:hypothetical protein [Portunus trituberculatus]